MQEQEEKKVKFHPLNFISLFGMNYLITLLGTHLGWSDGPVIFLMLLNSIFWPFKILSLQNVEKPKE
jgi:hypothetical protein